MKKITDIDMDIVLRDIVENKLSSSQVKKLINRAKALPVDAMD